MLLLRIRSPDRGQNLDLRRDVKRRGRLVEHQQIRSAGHRHRRHDALQLAARDLVRIAPANGRRLRQVEFAIEFDGPAGGVARIHDVVAHRGLDHLIVEPFRRVERRRRALGDIGRAHPAHLPDLVLVESSQIHAVEQDAAAGDPATGPRKAHGGETDGRLAGARFADQAQNLAAPELDVDIVDDPERVPVGAARLDAQRLHVEQEFAVGCRRLRVAHGLTHRIPRWPNGWTGPARSRPED